MAKQSIVLVSSKTLSNMEASLVPYLQARGVIPKDGRFDMASWIRNWLGSQTGFFWGAVSRHPVPGGIYLVNPHRQSEEGGSYTVHFRIGDCRAMLQSAERVSGAFYVKVLEADRGRASVEVCSAPKSESAYTNQFRVFHTADGVTGQLEAFAGTNALQLVNITPNERMAIEDLSQLPEHISVRKDSFPLEPVLLETGQGELPNASHLCCECHNCHGKKEVECEKCGGSGQLTCNRCGGSGYVTCGKCKGSGDFYKDGDYIGECNLCDGTGRLDCRSCNGSGSISCFPCKGEGIFECWVCGGTGALRVLVDFKTGRFFRKYKDETTWLSPKEVFLSNESSGERIRLSGRWKDILRATEKQMRDEEEARARAAKIVKDGRAVDSCLERVLRLSPTSVKPFEIHNPVAATGRKMKGRVRYEFTVCGTPPWIPKPSSKGDSSTGEPEDRNESAGPFRGNTPVVMDGVTVPEGKGIVYESCDAEGRKLVFSFPIEVSVSSLEKRKLTVRADAIPPPERREREKKVHAGS